MNRLTVLGMLSALAVCCLATRLYHIQIVDGTWLSAQAAEEQSALVTIPALRGTITDRHGVLLADDVPAQFIAIDPQTADLPTVLARLERVTGSLSPTTDASIHAPHAQFAYVARKVPYDIAQRIKAMNLPGVTVTQEQTGQRIYPLGTLASTVIGYTGIDDTGLAGIESADNEILAGTPGTQRVYYDATGRPLPVAGATSLRTERDGTGIELTIDASLQAIVEHELSQGVTRFHAVSGTAIVMDPWTGDVLAMANLPTFDPNHWDRYPANDQRNRAVLDAYEPGSTYKLVLAAAALDSGDVTLTSRFPARNEITVDGWTIHNAEDGFMPNTGTTETLGQIIEYSHNVGATEIALAIGPSTLETMEHRAGFGAPTDIGIGGESAGIIPDASNAAVLATTAFGQGVAVTPIQLTRFYCAIANGGLLLKPLLIRAYTTSLDTTHPEIIRRLFSERTAAQLRSFLHDVVLHGTGNPTAQVPGYDVAGKTGTSQIADRGHYLSGAYTASFVGMIPYNHPRYVIFVQINRPHGAYYGSVVAAPVFSRIAQAAMLLNSEPTP